MLKLPNSSQPAKKTLAKKTGTKGKASSSGQGTLSLAPSGRSSTRAAATRAKGKMANVVSYIVVFFRVYSIDSVIL